MKKKKMPSEVHFQVDYALLCEAVRKEIMGKDIIIGAVPDGLMVPQFPAVVPCCFWVVTQVSKLPAGQHSLKLRLREKKEESPLIVDFHELVFGVEFVEKGLGSFATDTIQVEIDAPFNAVLEYSFDDCEFINIRDVDFVRIPGVP